MDKNVIKLSTVLLNWNRIDLLRTTVKSYLATVKENYELIIIDNNSTDGSRDFIEEICIANSKHRAILLDQNLGGEALNLGIEIANGEFIHVSENDLEYLSGWDSELLSKFMNFPELGQLSVFSPFHQVEIGEIWEDKPAIKTEQNGKIIFLALANVGTSSIFRKEIWQAGIRWGSVGSSTYRAPDDGVFSKEVKKIGYKVAWNDKYVVINWGHNIAEMKNRIEYYLNNVEGKASLGVTGYLKSLNEHGFHAIKHSNGKITLKQELPFKKSAAYFNQKIWKLWMEWLPVACKELLNILPIGSSFVLIDDEQFGDEILPQRHMKHLKEHGGESNGLPFDDIDAIDETLCHSNNGTNYIVIMWPSFWYFENYKLWIDYLHSTFSCSIANERIVVFNLQKAINI